MTLRVYLDIIPFGNEDDAYPIHEINIHNVGSLSDGICEYSYEIDGSGVFPETVIHKRSEGAIELVRKVLNTEREKTNESISDQ